METYVYELWDTVPGFFCQSFGESFEVSPDVISYNNHLSYAVCQNSKVFLDILFRI